MPSNQNSIGYSFAPNFENAELAQARGGTQTQGPLQVLSYRLKRSPAVLGGFSPLASDQYSGTGNSALIQSVLHTVLGPEAAQAFLASIEGERRGGQSGGFRPPQAPGQDAMLQLPAPGAGRPAPGGDRRGPMDAAQAIPFVHVNDPAQGRGQRNPFSPPEY